MSKRLVLLVLCAVLCFTRPLPAEVSPQPATPAPETTAAPPPIAPAPEGASAPLPAPDWLNLLTPAENAEMIGRRPNIKGEFRTKVREGSLLLVLDGIDITQLATVTGNGFSYRPVLVLAAGSHSLTISAKGEDGTDLQKSISFNTRHSEFLDEAAMNNELTVNYEGNLGRHNVQPSEPSSKVESNFRSETRVKDKEWLLSFVTNIRYLDQNAPLGGNGNPIKKGFNLADWLLTLSYNKDKTSFLANLGDVQVNESTYTVSGLARRGAVVTAGYDNYQLRLFDVKSQQVFGFRGGAGAGLDTEEHIIGLSGGARFFDNRLEARAIYASGGEPGDSYNIAGVAGPKRGTVLGFLVTSDFFQNRFRTELESAYSTFDPNIADEFARKSSQANRIKAMGMIDIYSYDIQYERVGKDFVSIGNLGGIQKDKEGVTAHGGLTLAPHTLNVTFSRYFDNITKDPLFARITNYQGGIDYGNTWSARFPFGVSYQRGVQESSDEPPGALPTDMETDTVTGRVGYVEGGLNINFMAALSRQNDRTPANAGSNSLTYALAPSYTLQNITISSNLQLNQTTPHSSHDTTNTYTVNLDLRSKWLKERLACDMAGTYTISHNNSSTVDNRNLMANMRIAYTLKNLLGFLTPSLGVRGTYTRTSDHVTPFATREEFALFGVLTAAIPFSL